jgi:hypothetical protein
MSDNGLKIEIGQWVVNKKGKVMKVTADDMPDLSYEDIERYATKEEILANGGCPIDLEYRMYFFVPYNLSPIQQGIQAGHALGEYALKYGRGNPVHLVWDFLEKWKTFMVMNGGTSNSSRDFNAIPYGSLNQIADALVEQEIEMAYFTEPDINEALTAVCFIADERVFNKDDYPEFWDFLAEQDGYDENPTRIEVKLTPIEEWADKYGQHFINWKEDIMGGHKNFFLRSLLRDKKFA